MLLRQRSRRRLIHQAPAAALADTASHAGIVGSGTATTEDVGENGKELAEATVL